MKMLQSYLLIILAHEAQKQEERLGEAACYDAFLIQGGYWTENFKEFKN